MTLPNFFKIRIVNKTGATIEFSTDGANNTFIITGLGYKFDSNGAVVWASAEETIFADPSADLSDNASAESAEYDNSSNLYVGMIFRARLETDNNSAGFIDIYWEWSANNAAAGTYPSDESDFDDEQDLEYIKSLVMAATTDQHRATNFRL